MATSKLTFQKRQKEMKRQEKQRAKAERRAQKKLAGPSEAVPREPLTRPLYDPQGNFSDPDPEKLNRFLSYRLNELFSMHGYGPARFLPTKSRPSIPTDELFRRPLSAGGTAGEVLKMLSSDAVFRRGIPLGRSQENEGFLGEKRASKAGAVPP